MILTLFLIPLNVLLLGMMIFLVLAFKKEKADETKVKEQLELIKKTYEDKAKEYQAQADESNKKMAEALAKATEAETNAQRISAECEAKITQTTTEVQKKMEEVQHLEDTMKGQAEEKIKEFEKEQRAEVEKNMVSIVMNVTKKVLEKTLSYEEHKEIIKKSIDEIKLED